MVIRAAPSLSSGAVKVKVYSYISRCAVMFFEYPFRINISGFKITISHLLVHTGIGCTIIPAILQIFLSIVFILKNGPADQCQ